MDSIKIVAIPPGHAPEEIRKEWVGLVIPLSSQETGALQVGVLSGIEQYHGGYIVLSRNAFDLLRTKSPPAYTWYMDNGFFGSHLVFARENCEFLPGVKTIVDHTLPETDTHDRCT